ncbi:hypothetical protein GH733_004012 [Mirounga leonina]|nr:hypothetical protein GH733_004012 [Mirounga leonina]
MSSSAGSGHQPSQSRAIPTRTVPISDAAQLPHDYCTTPGGTLFSTTPGGERRPPRRGRSLQPVSSAASSPASRRGPLTQGVSKRGRLRKRSSAKAPQPRPPAPPKPP